MNSDEPQHVIGTFTPLGFFGISFLCLVTYSIVLTLVFSPGLMVNDDVAMMAFASGDFTGKPESQLVFIGLIVGKILQGLYNLNRDLPWYPALFLFVQTFSASVLLTSIYKFSGHKFTKQLVGFLVLIGIFTPAFVLDLSFSTTAMYTSVNGVIAVVFLVLNAEKRNYAMLFLTTIVLVLAGSLRFDFLGSVCLLFAPLVALMVLSEKKYYALIGVLVLTIPIASHFLETQASKSNDWKNYLEFNRLRGSMHGTPDFVEYVSTAYEEKTYTDLRKFGWESEDLVLFGKWYFEDPNLFNVSTLSELRKRIDRTPSWLPFQDALQNVVLGREFLIICGLMILVYGLRMSTRKLKIFFVLQATCFFVVAVYISSRYRFPDRFALGVWFGFFAAILLSSLILGKEESREFYGDRTALVKVLVLGVISVVIANTIPHQFSGIEISKRNSLEHIEFQRQLLSLKYATSNGTTVFIGAQLTMAGTNPWRDDSFLKDRRFLGLGWPSLSPHQETRKRKMGLDGTLIVKLLDNSHRYVLTDQSVADLLSYSYLRRHNRKILFRRITQLDFGTLYRVEDMDVMSTSCKRNSSVCIAD